MGLRNRQTCRMQLLEKSKFIAGDMGVVLAVYSPMLADNPFDTLTISPLNFEGSHLCRNPTLEFPRLQEGVLGINGLYQFSERARGGVHGGDSLLGGSANRVYTFIHRF